MCSGKSSKTIAEKLFISPRTVENHIQNIYRKYGVRRRLELVHLLLRYSS
ncbi:MAG: LuxR C-terminal-related transcriptional regulator [Spirochaetales bacterium]|nr:LuxR C-terminal-related transcriptional regulator [Spirochaetales bacterium]MCF7937709.1 LuxR C-terminal-related transcriptional regulator [Spirochaetales bacterium]